MWEVAVFFSLLTAELRADTYDNDPAGVLLHDCSPYHVVSQIRSTHSEVDNERLWHIECRPVDFNLTCSWASFLNMNEMDLFFNCPEDQLLAGVFSEFVMELGDRRWAFLCCSAPNLGTTDCQQSPIVNYWNEDFTWNVPGLNYLTGVQTHGRNTDGDHRWSYSYCRETDDSEMVTSKILHTNDEVQDNLMEGDLASLGQDSGQVCRDCKWQKVGQLVQVPYVLEGSFSSLEKDTIFSAMKGFHLNTCVRFVPRQMEHSYLSILKLRGCWSYPGRIGGPQRLSLGRGCIYYGVIQHELLHALGFYHEQNRFDRDIHIHINYENIKNNRQKNFRKLKTNTLNIPYDYNSLLHYGPMEFSINGQQTITSYGQEIGQRIGMSVFDIVKVNKLYDCNDYLHTHGEWDNVLDGNLFHQCAAGQAVSSITSMHSSLKADRLWGFSCKSLEENLGCHWSGAVNEYWGPIDFSCQANEVIAGVRAQRLSYLWDRLWEFYCCTHPDLLLTMCQDTPLVNYWHEYFHFPVPSGNFLTAAKSTYNMETGDRRWSFSYCQQIS
ncbi:uncharacterized protein ACB058_005156 [Synchiropus picturatus]